MGNRCLSHLENEVMIPSLEADLEAIPEPEATTGSGQRLLEASVKVQQVLESVLLPGLGFGALPIPDAVPKGPQCFSRITCPTTLSDSCGTWGPYGC